MTIDEKLNKLVKDTIIVYAPYAMDDDLPDLLDDWDNWANAIEILQDKLRKMKEAK